MNIGLIDVDGHNFPNLALMKLSAWHKAKGDEVEWWWGFGEYDRVYMSKVFDTTYSADQPEPLNTKEIIRGGTGYGLENRLPDEVEHIYPDYSIYPELTKETAYGFLTRGCPRACGFCIVAGKEGRASAKVADLSEWWSGQKYIKLLDPIKPNLGALKLDTLSPHTIQKFYNGLSEEREGKPGPFPKSIKIVHGVLHKALGQAVAIGYLRANPADACTLPKVVRKELEPLDEDATARFIEAVKGHRYEIVFLVTLFTGMRQGEVLGLSWDCVDFAKGTILINKQLQKATGGGSVYNLLSTKNGKGRIVTPAPFVMDLLRAQKRRQTEWRLKAGQLWEDNGLVFTDELGNHLMPHTVYHNYKKVVASIGMPNARFHDLRHSYAVAAIRSGDDIKTVQGNLGHATAAFTLDVYGHVTDQMKRESADRMQQYIKRVING